MDTKGAIQSILPTILSPLGYVDFFDYEKDSITWARNGFAGFLTVHTDRFSINYDRGILIPKDDNLYLPYVKMVLEPILRSIAVGRRGPDGEDEFTKVYLSTIEEIEILMPIDIDGKVSLETQRAIWDNLQVQRDVQAEIKLLSTKINSLKIDLGNEIAQKKELRLWEIFTIKKGSAAYTKAYIKKCPGIYPLFSSQTTDNGVIGTIDKYDYDEECITWTTDGINAGTVFLRSGKFSMTTHCGALFLKDEYKDIIDLEYLFFFLNGILRKKAYGEQNRRVTRTIIERIIVPVPVDENGKTDMVEQKKIVNKLKIINYIQNDISGQFQKIIEANITH